MRREDDQELWDLLGKSATPEVSPFFARNVVRQVREQQNERASLLRWLRPRILAPAAVFALALTFAGVSVERGLRSRAGDNIQDQFAKLDPQDVDVVADLDNLTASDDDSVWDDDDSQSL